MTMRMHAVAIRCIGNFPDRMIELGLQLQKILGGRLGGFFAEG